ncbi:hypothetical protein HPB48_022895 [Haemaphysalis longicornis]|uniref:Uncharacterized protein n=1 Tax=Haemaphysalis longicornis TaxID=44386 RepID=A0A9J6FMW3_HAELO|nr:hypothetical protein HPB48_022895 [Haemaphysalis longicornis]
MKQANVLDASIMALGGRVPAFTGDGNNITIQDFLPKTHAEFQTLATKRSDTEPECVKLHRFLSAKKNDGEDVQSFASRLRALGNAAVGTQNGTDTVDKRKLRKTILAEQLCTQYMNGMRDPVHIFTLSRYPKNIAEAVKAAVREEKNERAVNHGHMPVRSVQEVDKETDQLRERLKRVERLLESSIAVQHKHIQQNGRRRSNKEEIAEMSCMGRAKAHF